MLGTTNVEAIDETCQLKASDGQEGADCGFAKMESEENSGTMHYGDGVVFFDEISAAKGALGRFPGQQLLPLIQRLMHHT